MYSEEDRTNGSTNLVFWQDTHITLKAGEIMIFPSNFLYPHRVDLVTKGTRYSYVSWTW